MKKVISLFLSLSFVLVSIAQSNPDAEYWVTYQYTPKKGMTSKFENAVREKTKLYNKADNPVFTAIVTTGELSENGRYERVMPRRDIDWFIKDRSAEGNYWINNVDKYIQQGEGPYVWMRAKNLSINFDEPSPTKYLRVLTRVIKNGNNMDFWRYLGRYSAVLKKTRPDIKWAVFRLDSGGNANTIRIVTAYNDMKNPQGETKGGETQEVYNEMFGPGSWEDDFQKYNERLIEWARPQFNYQLRADLSTSN